MKYWEIWGEPDLDAHEEFNKRLMEQMEAEAETEVEEE